MKQPALAQLQPLLQLQQAQVQVRAVQVVLVATRRGNGLYGQ